MKYQAPQHNAQLLQQLKEYSQAVMTVEKMNAYSAGIAATAFLLSLGIDSTREKHMVHIPFGESYESYRDLVVANIRALLADMGLSLFHAQGLPCPIASDDNVVGMVDFDATPTSITISCIASLVLCKRFLKALVTVMPGDVTPAIRRMSLGNSGLRTRKETIKLVEPLKNFSVAYPFLDETPAELWAKFAASNSNVLLLIGPPGTGKSSYIMGLLQARGWDNHTYLADSDDVLTSPGLVTYIRDVPQGSLVVTEDSDALVAKREDGNTGMSALLNATAGLISTDTKFIVSTNLANLSKVDPALIRPGRTYKVLHFRTLTHDEAMTARVVLGLPELDLPNDSKGLTLAEVLNTEEDTLESGRAVRQFGFNS